MADKTPKDSKTASDRIFLCVIDDTEEMEKALRFACHRAKNTNGRLALLYVIEPEDTDHWMLVGNLMSKERRQEAEEMMKVLSTLVHKRTGKMPVIYIREGNMEEELLELIAHEQDISIMILGAAANQSNPGPLISSLINKGEESIPIPITIVPGHLSDEQIDSIT